MLPLQGKRSIYEIRRVDLLEVIGNIERRKALSVAEKVRIWFNQMFRYALVVVPALDTTPPPIWMWWPCRCRQSTATRSCAWPNCRSTCSACAGTVAGCKRIGTAVADADRRAHR